MATVNQRLQDAAISHQIDLSKYSNSVVRSMLALLNRTDPDLRSQLAAAMDRMPKGAFTVDRLDSLLTALRQLSADGYSLLHSGMVGELRALTDYETSFQHALFSRTFPVPVSVATVDVGQVYAAAMARPFQGRLLKEWADGLSTDKLTRIRDAVRMGYVQNQTTEQVIQRVFGTRARGYSDGLIEGDRRNAEAVVRTAISHTAGVARDAFYEANSDLVTVKVWCSTLDLRTSSGCQARDGLKYTMANKPVGHSIPWLGGPGRLHWNCRSSSTVVTKSWEELGLDGADLSPDQRASMDGAVPADTTYSEWLSKQSAARQDQVLGPTRGRMLRSGEYKVEQFYSDKGTFLTLDQLKAQDAGAR